MSTTQNISTPTASRRHKIMIAIALVVVTVAVGGGYQYGLEQGRMQGEKVGSLCTLYDLRLVDSVTEDMNQTKRIYTLAYLNMGNDGLKKNPGSQQFTMEFPYFQPRWYPLDTTRKDPLKAHSE